MMIKLLSPGMKNYRNFHDLRIWRKIFSTWSLPSRLLGMVTHLVGLPGLESAVSKDSMAPFVFFNFFTKASTAWENRECSGRSNTPVEFMPILPSRVNNIKIVTFSAHFSSSSPCFQPSRRLTAGEVKEKRELMLPVTPDITKLSSASSCSSLHKLSSSGSTACGEAALTLLLLILPYHH